MNESIHLWIVTYWPLYLCLILDFIYIFSPKLWSVQPSVKYSFLPPFLNECISTRPLVILNKFKDNLKSKRLEAYIKIIRNAWSSNEHYIQLAMCSDFFLFLPYWDWKVGHTVFLTKQKSKKIVLFNFPPFLLYTYTLTHTNACI